MIIKAWIDSSANIDSRNDIDIEIDKEDWSAMNEEQKTNFVKDEVFQYLDWGWSEPE